MQQVGVVVGVGAGEVRQDSGIRVRGLQEGGPRAVGVDHAVLVVRVRDPAERLGPDDEHAPGVAGADEVVGRDHGLQPARAPEGQVEGDRVRVLDAQPVLDARGQGRHGVAAHAAGRDVPEVVGHDDVVQALPVDPLQRGLGRVEAHAGGAHVVVRIAALFDPGDLVQLADDLRVRPFRPLARRVVELVLEKVVVGDPPGRDVASGFGDDRVRHICGCIPVRFQEFPPCFAETVF